MEKNVNKLMKKMKDGDLSAFSVLSVKADPAFARRVPRQFKCIRTAGLRRSPGRRRDALEGGGFIKITVDIWAQLYYD